MWEQIKRYFENDVLVALGTLWAWLITFLLPTSAIATSVSAVLIMMCLDLVTKIYSLSRQCGSFKKAVRSHRITSNQLAKGTLDKLLIFGILLVIDGCAYNLLVVKDIAIWFSQVVFGVMFLRDTISILENLQDAGVQGLGLFKRLVQNKLDNICDETATEDKEVHK